MNVLMGYHFFLGGGWPFPPFLPARASNSFCSSSHLISSSGVLMHAPSITTFSTISSSFVPFETLTNTYAFLSLSNVFAYYSPLPFKCFLSPVFSPKSMTFGFDSSSVILVYVSSNSFTLLLRASVYFLTSSIYALISPFSLAILYSSDSTTCSSFFSSSYFFPVGFAGAFFDFFSSS